MASRRHVRYTPLTSEDRDDDVTENEEDLRFDYTPKSFDRIPWKSITLALFLLCLGSLLLFLSFFIFTGHMGGDQSQAYGLLVLGILAFLPGFYETRVAYYSWRGARGFTGVGAPAIHANAKKGSELFMRDSSYSKGTLYLEGQYPRNCFQPDEKLSAGMDSTWAWMPAFGIPTTDFSGDLLNA